MEMNDKEKAKVLLQIIGVGDQLYELDTKCSTLYNRRLEDWQNRGSEGKIRERDAGISGCAERAGQRV